MRKANNVGENIANGSVISERHSGTDPLCPGLIGPYYLNNK